MSTGRRAGIGSIDPAARVRSVAAAGGGWRVLRCARATCGGRHRTGQVGGGSAAPCSTLVGRRAVLYPRGEGFRYRAGAVKAGHPWLCAAAVDVARTIRFESCPW
jgi:hypothetical protein